MNPRFNPVFICLIVIVTSAFAQAAIYEWNGRSTGGATGVSEIWDSYAPNWTGAGTTWPISDGSDNDDAVFAGTAGTVTLLGTVVANDLTFNTANYKSKGKPYC